MLLLVTVHALLKKQRDNLKKKKDDDSWNGNINNFSKKT